jgi:long-chain acyl-CoA synthetase
MAGIRLETGWFPPQANPYPSAEEDMDRLWLKHYDPAVAHHLKYPDQSIPRLVEQTAGEFPEHPATEFFGAKLTYRQLWEQVQRFAAGLAGLGVRPQTRVAIMLPNCPQAIIAYYATLWLGGVVVTTNPMYVEREMEHQWSDAGAEILIALDHLYPRVEKVLAKTPVRSVIVTSLREYLPFYLKWLYPLKARKQKLFMAVPYDGKVLNFSAIIRDTQALAEGFPSQPEDLALLQYTGGTTGVAKGVMLSHGNILANVMQISAWFPGLQRGKERIVSILPFFHVFGMTVAMNWPLYNGATIILSPKFQVDGFLKLLHKSRPTIFPGVPTIFLAIVNHPKISEYDLSSVRFCITGSAPMPLEILTKFETMTGSVIVEGFGLSESSPVTHVNPIDGVRKPGSIGLPVPDTDARVVQLDGSEQDVSVGEVGELIVRGPQVMKGYWNMPEETVHALRAGWLYTGDIAKMDEDGYFYIVDRKKDMVIAGGFNIYPREIEEVLYQHPKVLDAVVIGIPDPYRGETVKAFVVPKPGVELTEGEVLGFCRTKLAAYKMPKVVELRESLPKTMVGKILRRELRAEELSKTQGPKPQV